MRKQDHAKMMLTSLQAHCRHTTDLFFAQYMLKLIESGSRKSRQRLSHFSQMMKSHKSTPPVCQLGYVLARAAVFNLPQELSRKALLYVGQQVAPALGK